MEEAISIRFKVTPSDGQTIELRAKENGFDDIASYLKVVALKTQPFNLTPLRTSYEEASVELGFELSEAQNQRLQENIAQSECEALEEYMHYVALHGVVTSVVEIRSTGSLDAMLARIAASKKPN